jgi:hypothetical protein
MARLLQRPARAWMPQPGRWRAAREALFGPPRSLRLLIDRYGGLVSFVDAGTVPAHVVLRELVAGRRIHAAGAPMARSHHGAAPEDFEPPWVCRRP